MNMSFYVGALGADASQKKMGVISNNLANINNTAFKPKNAIFSDLIKRFSGSKDRFAGRGGNRGGSYQYGV